MTADSMRFGRWLARAEIATFALLSIVAVGIASEMTGIPPAGLSLRALAVILFVLQAVAIGLALHARARTTRDRAQLDNLLDYRRGLSDLSKCCAALSSSLDRRELRASLDRLVASLGATRLLVVGRSGQRALGVV